MLVCAVLLAFLQSPDSVVYRVDPSSRLVVKTGKAGLLGFAGHSHVIRARAIAAELVYEPGKPGSHLRIRLPTDSLEVLTPNDTAEIRKVTQAMRTEVLQVDRYPEMSFSADSVDAKSGKVELRLDVTMHGTTRQVPVIAQVKMGGDTVRATGSFTARQTDFGIKPFSGGPGGTVKVADKVTFCFDLVATRGKQGTPGLTSLRPEGTTEVAGCVDRQSQPERRVM